MSSSQPAWVFLPGAGDGSFDFSSLGIDPTKWRVFKMGYPGWRRYVAKDFTGAVLIAELAAEIASRVPSGPLYIFGYSIGAHFAYAIALDLERRGRYVSGLCIIDPHTNVSSKLAAGWSSRVYGHAAYLLEKRRFAEFGRYVESLFLRTAFRLTRGRLVQLMRRFARFPRISTRAKGKFGFSAELSMLLLIRQTADYILSLDRNTVPVSARSALIRTEANATGDERWRQRCPNIIIHPIPGAHLSMFDSENVAFLRAIFLRAVENWAER